MLREVDRKYLGIYFDIAHATIEGGLSWPLEAKLVEPHLMTVSVKDFFWVRPENGKKGRPEWCPLGDGMVDRSFFRTLQKTGFSGPVSMHFEYELGSGDAAVAAVAKDTRTLRRWLSGS